MASPSENIFLNSRYTVGAAAMIWAGGEGERKGRAVPLVTVVVLINKEGVAVFLWTLGQQHRPTMG
jgi:hypothetical protein